MWQISGKHLGHDIAGLKIPGCLPVWKSLPLPREENLQVGHAAMINMGIGARQPPTARIKAKVGAHVLVHELLEIHTKRLTISAYHDIGADSALGWHIPTGIGDADVSRIVDGCHSYLAAGRDKQALLPCEGRTALCIGSGLRIGSERHNQRSRREGKKGATIHEVESVRKRIKLFRYRVSPLTI
jgi:hypothetical protein